MSRSDCAHRGARTFVSLPFLDGGDFARKESEPIKFGFSTKRLPFNPHLFFRVVQDVDAYPLFISHMPHCKADLSTQYSRHENGVVSGGFEAPTRIGFNAVSFEYTSRVSFEHPSLPVNLHPSSLGFD